MSKNASYYPFKLIKYKLGQLHDFEQNPVQLSEHAAKKLAEQLKRGQDLPYVAAAPPNGKAGLPLLDGHQRKQVELQLNHKSPDTLVPVLIPARPMTEREKKQWIVEHRKNTGEFDFDKLANFYDVPDLLDWGFSEKELLGAGFEFEDTSQDAEPQIDRAAELNKIWKVKMGDLFSIGNHRLLCGDSRKRADVERLMQKEKAVLFETDPPYGVDYIKTKSGIPDSGYATLADDYCPACGRLRLSRASPRLFAGWCGWLPLWRCSRGRWLGWLSGRRSF